MPDEQENHAIAKLTARCAPCMSALKIYVSAKSADDCTRIATLQSYHCSVVKLFSKYFNQCDHGTLQTDKQTDTVASPHGKNRETNYRRYYRYHRYFKSKIPVYCRF